MRRGKEVGSGGGEREKEGEKGEEERLRRRERGRGEREGGQNGMYLKCVNGEAEAMLCLYTQSAISRVQ